MRPTTPVEDMRICLGDDLKSDGKLINERRKNVLHKNKF